jgi:predicted Zn-dependent protease
MKKIIHSMLFLSLALGSTAIYARSFSLDFGKLKDTADKVKALREPDEEDEIEIGKGVAARLLGASPLVKDGDLQRYVNRVGLWVALHSERPNLPWRFGVLDDSDINAFATPGGYILITRGMLLRMRDEAELAGVLGHEITHVVEKHALKTMRKGAMAGLAGDALSNYAEKKSKKDLSKVVGGFTEIYTRGLDKEDELDADRGGVVMAARAGYDPYGLPSVLQMLASINPKDSAVALMFKTHPDSEERLKKVTKAMDGELDEFADQARVANRFAEVMQTHLARYEAKKNKKED